MNELRIKIIEAAESQLGVKYHKDAKCPNVGFDCVQFVGWCYEQGTGVVANFPLQGPCTGFTDNRIPNYLKALGGQQISLEEALPADVIVWKYRGTPHHTGMILKSFSEGSRAWCIHSCAKYGKIVSHPIGAEWGPGQRFHSVWRLLDK